ncbi:MAG: hypothetical protein WA941_01635 [Nitrososphaeraceae archaeon]
MQVNKKPFSPQPEQHTSLFFIKVVIGQNPPCQLTREFVDVDKPEI